MGRLQLGSEFHFCEVYTAAVGCVLFRSNSFRSLEHRFSLILPSEASTTTKRPPSEDRLRETPILVAHPYSNFKDHD